MSNNTITRAANETITQQSVGSPSSNSLYKSSNSQIIHDNKFIENTANIENVDGRKFRNDDDEEGDMHGRDKDEEQDDEQDEEDEEDEEEEFSSHFERMKLNVEEPAFLPRRLSGGHSNLSLSRQQLSLSIQNLRKPSNVFVAEVTPPPPQTQGSSSTSAAAIVAATTTSSSTSSSPRKILSPQIHSPAIRPSNTVTSVHGSGSNNNSAINSSTSSFSDISESSVTQSAMEDAFLSNFNHGSKMYVDRIPNFMQITYADIFLFS